MRILAITATAALIASTSGAFAATFSGSFGGEWTQSYLFNGQDEADYDANNQFSISPDGKTASWGNTADNAYSTLTIVDDAFSYDILGGTQDYDVAKFTWFNGAWNNFDNYFELWGDLDLDIDQPNPIAPDGDGIDTIGFKVRTTSNSATVSDDGATLVSFSDFRLDLSEGIELADGITLTEFVLRVEGVDAGLSGTEWSNGEGETAHLYIAARITNDNLPPPVPLPAAGWMLLAGVGGMAAMKRRKKKAT